MEYLQSDFLVSLLSCNNEEVIFKTIIVDDGAKRIHFPCPIDNEFDLQEIAMFLSVDINGRCGRSSPSTVTSYLPGYSFKDTEKTPVLDLSIFLCNQQMQMTFGSD